MTLLRVGGLAVDTFVCSNCGNEFPLRQVKEVFWEEGRRRLKQELCPACLDQRMNQTDEVRGIVGQKKAAAIHINPARSKHGIHISIGERSSKGTSREIDPPDDLSAGLAKASDDKPLGTEGRRSDR